MAACNSDMIWRAERMSGLVRWMRVTINCAQEVLQQMSTQRLLMQPESDPRLQHVVLELTRE